MKNSLTPRRRLAVHHVQHRRSEIEVELLRPHVSIESKHRAGPDLADFRSGWPVCWPPVARMLATSASWPAGDFENLSN